MARDEVAADEPPEERILALEELYFKQICRVRIGRPPDSSHFGQLVATNDKYGLVAAGHASGVRVIRIATILAIDVQATDKVNTIIDDIDVIGDIALTLEPVHIGFSADGLIMSVACHSQQAHANSSSLAPTVYFHDVRAFCRTKAPEPFIQSSLGAGRGSAITDFRWNPEESDVFAACLSNGSLVVAKCCFPGQIDLKELAPQPTGSAAAGSRGCGDAITCICWSPKGKQLVAGRADGLLLQFSKTLEVKARIPVPPGMSKVSALSVLWQSTYVFFASYGELDPTASDDQPTMVGVHLAKDGQVAAYLNYGDVCYGSSDAGQQCGYYMIQIPKWDIVLTLSATSVNSCVLGKLSAEQPWPWQTWTLDDSGQIALPLQEAEDIDSFPRGLALTLAAQDEVPGQGPGQSYPASPIVFVLSTEGLLMPYHAINSLPTSSSVTKPPEPLSAAGKEFINSLPAAETAANVHIGVSLPQPAGGGTLGDKPASFSTIFGSNFSQGLGSMSSNKSAQPTMAESPAALPVTGSKPKFIPPTASQSQQVPPAYNEAASGMRTYSETPAGLPGLTKVPPEGVFKQPVQLEQRTSATAVMPTPTISSAAMSTELEPKSMTTDSLYARAIQEEVIDFGKEVAALRLSCRRDLNVGDIVGSKEEFVALRKQLGEQVEDWKNIMATVQSCSTDVHELKLKNLETFTLLEQCRSMQRCYEYPEYQDLLKSRPLDPLLKAKSQEVERLYRSVRQNLDELAQRVDDDWANVVQRQQCQAINGSGRTLDAVGVSPGRARERPSDSRLRALDCNDKIYATTRTAELILRSQELLVDDMAKRLKAVHLGSRCSGGGAALVRSHHCRSDISAEECASDAASGPGLSGDGQREAVVDSRPRRLTPAANAHLCRYLGSRKVTDAVAAAPASLSLSKVIAAGKLKQQLTLLQRSSGNLPSGEAGARDSGRAIAGHQQSEQSRSTTKEPAVASIGSAATQTHAPVGGLALGGPEASSKFAAGPSLATSAQDRMLQQQQRQAAAAVGSSFAVAAAPGSHALTSVVPPAAGKTALPTFSSMTQPSAQGVNVDRLTVGAAESVRPMPSAAQPLRRTAPLGGASVSGGSSTSATFKPMAAPAGQLPFAATGSGNPPSAFSIFGGSGGSVSSVGRAAEKPTPSASADSGDTAGTDASLPQLVSVAQKAEVPGRLGQASQLSTMAVGSGAPPGIPAVSASAELTKAPKNVVPIATGNSTSMPGVAAVFGQNRPATIGGSHQQPTSAVATAAPTMFGNVGAVNTVGPAALGSSSGTGFGASLFGSATARTSAFSGLASAVTGGGDTSGQPLPQQQQSSSRFAFAPAVSPPDTRATPSVAATVTTALAQASPVLSQPSAGPSAVGGPLQPLTAAVSVPQTGAAASEKAGPAAPLSAGTAPYTPIRMVAGVVASAIPTLTAAAVAADTAAATVSTSALSGAVPAATTITSSAGAAASPVFPAATAVGSGSVLPGTPSVLPAASLPSASTWTGATAAAPVFGSASVLGTFAPSGGSIFGKPLSLPTAATSADAPAAATTAAAVPAPPLAPSASLPAAAAATAASAAAVNPAFSATTGAGPGVALPATSSVTSAVSAQPTSSWTGAASVTPVFGSAALGTSALSGGGIFGKPPSLPATTTTTDAAAKDGIPTSTASVDTEMSTEQDDTSAVGGGGLGFGAGGGGNVLGLGGKADPEKAKLNPFGLVSAASSTGASDAAKLFGSPVRPSVFGGAPAFGSPAGVAAGGATVFGSSPVVAPASGGGLVQSPFASAGSSAPSVFGGGGGFGTAPAHAQFGAPPAFGAGSSVFGGGAGTFGGSAAFGASPVFGALAGQRSFGGGSPAASVFGGQAQIGTGSAPSATFGGGFAAASVASQPTFGMLAQQQPAAQPTFGMLVQQQTPAVQPGSVFGGAAFGSGSPGAAPKIQSPSFTAYRK